MGRNKKKPNPPPPPPNTSTGAPPPPPPPPTNNPNQEQTDIDQELSLIESECQAAIAAHTAGNPGEAFTLIEETRHHYENWGIVYAAQYELHALEASRVETSDAVLFQKHVRSGVESARRALSLLPYSTELRTLYAQALYKLSGCVVDGFDEVLRECERALSIENPLHHCRDASLSLMARDSEETSKSGSFVMSKRKKQAVLKEVVSATVKMGKSRTYWNTMSGVTKIGLIGPRIGDLRAYYSTLCKDGSAKRVFFLEGIGYAEKNENWKFWLCYYCDEKFKDFGLRIKHIEQMHEGVIGKNSQMKRFFFQEIDADSKSELYDDFLGNIYVINERILLTGDLSWPLDDRLLRVEVIPHRHHDRNDSATTCSICDAEVAVPPDTDAFGQWLFNGPPTSTTEELSAWKHLQDQMKQEGMEVPKKFEEEFILFRSLCRKQSELMVQCRSLRGIVIICAQELHKREQGGEHVAKSYKSLLKEKLEPLVKAKEDSMSPAQRSDLSVLVGVLTEDQNIRHARDQAASVEDEEDASIRMAIQEKMDLPLSELCTNEARITRSSVVMLRLWAIYNQTSLDYRGIMLPLVRNFVHAKLEAWVYEEEKQKSDAATEALLAELALDTEKNTSKGNNDPKVSKKTSKPKKKMTDPREVKDPKATNEAAAIKATSSDKLPVVQEEKTGQADFHVAAASADELKLEERLDHQRQFEEEAKQKALAKETTNEAAPTKATRGDELTEAQEEKTEQAHFAVVGVSADELKLQEEELRRNIFLEDRKLKENFEYQRQVEDEAKRMALAKETTNEAAPIKVEESDKPVVVCSQMTERRREKDTSKAQKNLPLKTIPESEEDLGVSSTFGTFGSISGADIFNPGLRNDAGEYNCFLNVIVQTLWHLRKFREVFMSRSSSEHVHIGDPCVVCALKEIFIALSVASANKQREAISPTSLRNAVIKLNPDRNLFQEPHMNDTTDVLANILDSLHESSMGSNSAVCSWDCVSDACLAHNLFGMAIHEKIICLNCGIESSEEKYTSCMNGICTSFLRTMKNMQPESHFDELFKLVESNYAECDPQFACDPEKGGCGKPKSLRSYLRTPPHVFSIGLLWPTDCESREDIFETLTALTTEIDLAVFYDGLVLGNKHSLFSMVCYYGKHHICFVYIHELEKWIMYDDETVEEVGCWDDIISKCERGCLQPRFLFFEAVK